LEKPASEVVSTDPGPEFGVDHRLFLALLGLFGLGVAQPFFSLVGANPTFFVAHRTGALEILWLTALVFLGPPTLVWLLTFAASKVAGPAVGALVPVGLAILAAVAIGGYVWRPADLQVELAIALVVPLAALLYLGLRRYHALGSAIANLGWISLVFPIMFLFFSPVADLVFASDDSEQAAGGLGAQVDTSIALIVLDELPLSSMLDDDGNIDRARLPNFARLADMSTWYRDTTTVSTQTLVAIPSILTGRVQLTAPAPTAANYPSSLFVELAPSHGVDAWESVTRLCPTDICSSSPYSSRSLLLDDSWIVILNQVLPPGVARRWVPSITDQWTQFRQPRVTRPRNISADDEWEFPWDDLDQNQATQFRSLTARIGTTDTPTFWYEHVLLPHTPWFHRPDGSGNEGEWIPWLDDGVWPGGADHERGVLMHAMQVEFVDTLLGEFLDNVEATGRFDDMMLVVMADHGVALQEGFSRRSYAPETAAELTRVPLLVKYPGQLSGAIDDREAEITDVFATVADVLEIDGIDATTLDGRSLLGDPASGRNRLNEPSTLQFAEAVDRFHSWVPPGVSAEEPFDELMARN
jgi:hypothetical protein